MTNINSFNFDGCTDKGNEVFLVKLPNYDFCLVRLYQAFGTNFSFGISPFAIEFGVFVTGNNVTDGI